MSFLWVWSMFCLDLSSGKEGGPPPSFKTSEIGLEEGRNVEICEKTYVKHLLQGQEVGKDNWVK